MWCLLGYKEEGKLRMAGAWSTVTGGMFIFSGTEADIHEFTAADPYFQAKLVSSHSIKEWNGHGRYASSGEQKTNVRVHNSY